jgi:hypothetical protein
MGDDLQAALGQDDIVRLAHQKPGAQHCLQLSDGLAGGRLRHTAERGSLSDGAAVGDGNQQAPVKKIMHRRASS